MNASTAAGLFCSAIRFFLHKNPLIFPLERRVEKGFVRLKNAFDLHRLRVHSDHAARDKLFVGFLAQILACSIFDRMERTGLLGAYTLQKLLHVLGGWRVDTVRGVEILGIQTKAQREILR